MALVALFSMGSVNANTDDLFDNIAVEVNSMEMADHLVGGWTYTVENAPAGYENGFMVIAKQDDQYRVQLQVGTGTFVGENVIAKGKEISFDVVIEGAKVSLALTTKGSVITGKATSQEGSYAINGMKSISTE